MRRHSLRVFLGMLLALLLSATRATALDLGKDIERGLGEIVGEEIEAAYGVVDDPLLTNWVNRVGQRLAAASGRTNIKYQFKILDSNDVNAVAAPGGFIYVNRGTLRFIRSEDELAAVLGHEVGHVAGRHSMKQLTAQLIGTLALLGLQSVGAETLKTVGSIAGGLAMLKYSRDHENDADRRGLRNAVATGYDGQALLAFFRRLQSREKDRPSQLEVYFLTHPPTTERLNRVSREPGTADTAANALALGDGYAARFLFRQAAAAYRRALERDPGNVEAKHRLADALRQAPQASAVPALSPEDRAQYLAQLAALEEEIGAARAAIEADRRRLSSTQKETDSELELAARSLSTASRMISRRDPVRYRQLVRMARSFDQAARIGGQLRVAHEMTQEAFEELTRLQQMLREAVERGDGAAGAQVETLREVRMMLLRDLVPGFQQARSRAGEALEGARILRQAADSLLTSYRLPLGYSQGQFSILDMQVSASQDYLRGAVDSTRRALAPVARTLVEAQVRRIDFLTRAVTPEDVATAGIIGRYLGAEPSVVTAARAHQSFGEAALTVARDVVARAVAKKRRPKEKEGSDLQYENAALLFRLIANDLEREITSHN